MPGPSHVPCAVLGQAQMSVESCAGSEASSEPPTSGASISPVYMSRAQSFVCAVKLAETLLSGSEACRAEELVASTSTAYETVPISLAHACHPSGDSVTRRPGSPALQRCERRTEREGQGIGPLSCRQACSTAAC